jgi:hypothetical protein
VKRSSGEFKRAVTAWVGAGVIALLAASPAASNLRADYRFEGNFNNRVGSAPDLVPVGVDETCPPSCFKFGVPVKGTSQGAWDWAEGAGLRLDDARKAVGSPRTYSIVLLLRLDDVADYNKLIDFDNLDSEQGLYVDSGYLDIWPFEESDEEVIRDDRWRQIVLTRNRAGKVRGYVDGERVAATKDPDEVQMLGADEKLHFLIDDGSDEHSGGYIARLRIYDGALSPRAVRKLGV